MSDGSEFQSSYSDWKFDSIQFNSITNLHSAV